jgi:hypothetical protein
LLRSDRSIGSQLGLQAQLGCVVFAHADCLAVSRGGGNKKIRRTAPSALRPGPGSFTTPPHR